MSNDLEPELPLDIPTAEEAALLPERGYKQEWEEASVRLFQRWKADVDAAAPATTITKLDAMKGFKPIPDTICKRFTYLGKTLLIETVSLASKLAADFVTGAWIDPVFVEDLRKKSDREIAQMTNFLDQMESGGVVCQCCRHKVPAFEPLVSAHCLIGLIMRWQRDVPRMGRALQLIRSGVLTAAPRPHHPSQP